MPAPLSLPAPASYGIDEAPWKLIMAEFDGTPIGDITDTSERVLKFPLNRAPQIEFTMDLQHPAMDELLSRENVLIKAYRSGQLKALCEVVTHHVAGDHETHRIKVVASDAAFVRLAKRLVGKSAAGQAFAAVDRGAIVATMVWLANVDDESYIRMGSIVPSSTVNVGPWYYKPILEAITELSNDLGGFDFWVEPVDPDADPNSIIGYLNVSPLRGGLRENAVFEYGTGRHNVRSYEWVLDRKDRISRAYSLPSGYPDNAGLAVVYADDPATEAAITRREVLVDADLTDVSLRQTLANEHVAVRKNPRGIFKFQPHVTDNTGRVPEPLTDYNPGDMLEGRVIDQGTLMLDGIVRVYGIDVALDDSGTETPTLTLVEEELGSE